MAEDATEGAAIEFVGVEGNVVRGEWFSEPLHVVLHEELNHFAADAAAAFERFPDAAAGGHVSSKTHGVDYRVARPPCLETRFSVGFSLQP